MAWRTLEAPGRKKRNSPTVASFALEEGRSPLTETE